MLRGRVLVALLVLVLAGAVVGPSALLVHQQGAAEQEVLEVSQRRMSAINRITVLAVEGLLRTSRNAISTQAAREGTVRAFALPPGRERDDALSALAEELQRADAAAVSSFAVDPDGAVRGSSPPVPGLHGDRFTHRDWYRGAMSQYQPYVSEGYRSALPGKPLVVAVVRAVRDGQGRVVGLLGSAVRLDALQELVDAQTGLPQLRLTVVDRYDQVLARTGGGVQALRPVTERLLSSFPPGSGPRSGRPRQAEDGDVWAVARLAREEGAVLVEVPGTAVVGRLPEQQRTTRAVLAVLLLVLLTGGGAGVRLARARLETQRALQESRRQLALSARMAGVGHFDVDPHTGRSSYSDEVLALWGATPDDAHQHDGRLFRERLVHPDDRAELEARLHAVLRGGGTDSCVVRAHRLHDGALRYLRVTVSRERGPDGTLPPLATGGMLDVTDLEEARRAAEEAGALHRGVLAASPDVIHLVDVRTGALVWISDGAEAVLGRSPRELVGPVAAITALVHPEDVPGLQAEAARVLALADGEVAESRARVQRPDGGWTWVSRRVVVFSRDEQGAVAQVLGVLRDISGLVEAEERLRSAAERDALTGLPNRALLADRLGEALARSRRSAQPVAVLLVDLDGFKRVNDSAGHAAGDALLVEVARRLQACVRAGDTVARLGGDEFVVVLEHDAADELDPQTAAVVVARRVRQAVARPVVVDGTAHHVTASTGLTFSSSPDDDADRLLRDADAAMYRAKASGKDRFEVFEVALRAEAERRTHVEGALRSALGRRSTPPAPRAEGGLEEGARLWVAYQPVVREDGTVTGVEALARLDDSDGVPVPPAEFVPVAEATGLVDALGTVVLHDALGACARWREDSPELRVSVNLSALQAREPGLVDLVRRALALRALPPEALVLEVTESVLLEAAGPQGSALRALHEAGVGLAIDDFGTGHASLRYLAELPVDIVKVDRSFVSGLPGDRIGAAVVGAVSRLAAELGLVCVAEGVETEEQRAALAPGVVVQGYLLGRPLPAAAVDLAPRLPAQV